jgi:hypothetical protein
MTAMRAATVTKRLGRSLRACAAVGALLAALALSGCSTGQPRPISASALAEAQTFPYFKVYWVGHTFLGHQLAAADGLRSYISSVGDSVYYGDCVQSKGIFGTGTCKLPLQVTTVIYHQHSNGPLGPQQNILVRGVPATVYEEGRSVEIYTGQVAIDVYSDTPAHAMVATAQLRPANASGAPLVPLPPPIYCPGLSGPEPPEVLHVMEHLPKRVCQVSAARKTYAKSLKH